MSAHYRKTLTYKDASGYLHAAASAACYVYDKGTTTLLTLYSDEACATPLANPLTTSAAGLCEFYLAAAQSAKLVYSGTGFTTVTLDDEAVYHDPEDVDDESETYNVLDYGATGDGTTNDTAAVQSCLDAAIATGGTVVFPKGTYLCGNLEIEDATDLTIRGEGAQITWTGTAAGDNSIGIQLLGTCRRLRITGLYLLGDGVVANRHAGVWNNSGADLYDVTLDHLNVKSCVLGLNAHNGAAGDVQGLFIHHNRIDTIVGTDSGEGYGIQVSNLTPQDAGHQFVITDNIIRNCSRHAIYVARCDGALVRGNTVVEHRTDETQALRPAVFVARSSHVLVEGNRFHACKSSCLGVAREGVDATDITLRGNVFSHPADDSPQIWVGSPYPATTNEEAAATEGAPVNITVQDNTFYSDGTAADAIRLYCGLGVRVIGNTIVHANATTATNGLMLYAEDETAGTAVYSDDWYFENNHVFGTVSGAGTVRGFRLVGDGTAHFNSSACAATFIRNTFHGCSASFSCEAALTNANVTVALQPRDGLNPTTWGLAYELGPANVEGAPILQTTRHRVTVAEANAGHTILAAVSGRGYRLVDFAVIAVGGSTTSAAATGLAIYGTQSAAEVALATIAKAALTQSTAVCPNSANVTMLANGAGTVACDDSTAITVRAVGGADLATATHFDVLLTYVLD